MKSCDCCPPNEDVNLVPIPIDYRSSNGLHDTFNFIIYNRENYMTCRDCFKDLDPLRDTMKDRLCSLCEDKNEKFWQELITVVEESYDEVQTY